jgi:uncharacterized phosphosugar-binding protein
MAGKELVMPLHSSGTIGSPPSQFRATFRQMKNAVDEYFRFVREQAAGIEKTQRDKIEIAAEWVSEALRQERFIYAFGSGHSHALAEEMFFRAGGLARVVPILDTRLMVHESASASTMWERQEGLATEILAKYKLGQGDIFFIISNSGRNAVPIEMALEGLKRGAKTIAVTSAKAAAHFPSRHSSGKKLSEVVNLSIDNFAEAGDAVIEIGSLRTGPTSTITSALILNSIVVAAVEKIFQSGDKKPEVWGSANAEVVNNEALLARYRGNIPHL